ncbi:MAG: hypothetical protein ABIH03_14820 [Pseudomonadota bacterium]
MTLTWYVAAGDVDPVYGDTQERTETTAEVRAVIKPFFEKQIEHQGFADVMPGDAVFIFSADVDLEDKGDLTFDTAAGKWRPIWNPPPAVVRYAALFPEDQQMVQWVFARYVKGTN